MTKEYLDELNDLKDGLKSILEIINNPKNLIKHTKAISNFHIQQARIDFFKKGYNFRCRELDIQMKIIDTPIEIVETGRQTCL